MKKPLKPRRLGQAEYVTANHPDENPERAGARWQFLKAVGRVVPAFSARLRDEVYPEYKRLASGTQGYWESGWKFETWQAHSDSDHVLTPLLRAWAQAFNLAGETWILEGALQTLANWHDHAGWRNALDIHGFRQFVCITPLISEEEHRFTFEDLGWDPQSTTFGAWRAHVQRRFKEALDAHAMRIRAIIKGHSAVQTAPHFTEDHFEWLARYQCGGQSLESILSTSPHVANKTTISKGMHQAARLVELTIRPKHSKLKSP